MFRKNEVIKFLQKKLGENIIDYASSTERRVDAKIKPAALRKAVKTLSGELNARFITISAVDHGLDMELLHHFSVEGNVVTLRTEIPKETSEVDTITDIIPAAFLIEREILDLFGVKFRNHPRPESLILPKEVVGNPLRKPLEGKLPLQGRPVADLLLSTGCNTSLSSFVKQKRKQMGLPQLPPASCSDEEALHEIQELMKRIDFDKRVGYDWEKKKLRYR